MGQAPSWPAVGGIEKLSRGGFRKLRFAAATRRLARRVTHYSYLTASFRTWHITHRGKFENTNGAGQHVITAAHFRVTSTTIWRIIENHAAHAQAGYGPAPLGVADQPARLEGSRAGHDSRTTVQRRGKIGLLCSHGLTLHFNQARCAAKDEETVRLKASLLAMKVIKDVIFGDDELLLEDG